MQDTKNEPCTRPLSKEERLLGIRLSPMELELREARRDFDVAIEAVFQLLVTLAQRKSMPLSELRRWLENLEPQEPPIAPDGTPR